MRATTPAVVALVFASLLSACATVSEAPPHPWVPPVATPPAGLEICWLEVGAKDFPAGHGAAGWTRSSKWEATVSVLLIRHPEGDVLVDTGGSPTVMTERQTLPMWNRFLIGQLNGGFEPRGDLLELLRRVGSSPERLRAIVLSHAHPDHAGGVPRLPGVPVWVGPGEPSYVAHESGIGIIPSHAEALAAVMTPVVWQPRPWGNFDESFDVFGDGSLVLVPLPGHTPGSIGSFVTTPSGARLLHVGDIISLSESIDRRVPKSKLISLLTDEDRNATEEMVAKLVQLAEADPGLTILPAHDRSAWQSVFGIREPGGTDPWCLDAKKGRGASSQVPAPLMNARSTGL